MSPELEATKLKMTSVTRNVGVFVFSLFMVLSADRSQARDAGKYAEVNGIRMYYESRGAGRPLVLIHGGGSTLKTTFGRIMPFLARKHRVIAVELQAHGHTSDRNAPESFQQDADDVAE